MTETEDGKATGWVGHYRDGKWIIENGTEKKVKKKKTVKKKTAKKKK
jgi:hypothetical protein